MGKKSVILYAPKFYGYGKFIAEEIGHQGNEVYYVEEVSRLLAFLLSFLPISFSRYVRENKIYRQLRNFPIEDIDSFFIIKGEYLSQRHISYLKERNPFIRIIMYQWDSLRNHDYKTFILQCDKVFTFDFKDAKELNINYLPLFYLKDIKAEHNVNDIDLLFVTTNTPMRTAYLSRLKELSIKHHFKLYYYLVNPLSTYITDMFNGNLYYKLSDIHFLPMKRERLIELYRRSKVFVDITSPLQTGLSMRIIECYGMNKKLITSNTNVEKDEYVKEILLLSSEASDDEVLKFLSLPCTTYRDIDKLSIRNWVKIILS